MTDNKFQFTPKPINTTIQATHSNAFSDVAVYGVYMETTGLVKERTLIFETNEKGLADSVLADYKATTYLQNAKFDITVKYIKHPIIEDGYYTYSHIYDTGKVIKYTIYNFPETYNIADIVSDWQEYVVHYTTTKTHWNYEHVLYSDNADGSDPYEFNFPNYNLLENTKHFSGNWSNIEHWHYDGLYQGCSVLTTHDRYGGLYKTLAITKDGYYTFSAFVKSSNGGQVWRWVNVNNTDISNLNLGSDFDWKRDTITLELKAGDTIHIRYEFFILGTGSILSVAMYKWEIGQIATDYFVSESEATQDDFPKFFGIRESNIEYKQHNPALYKWQTFTGTKPIPVKEHSTFTFISNVFDMLETVHGISPLNKRNLRHDSWNYQENTTYPFIGGTET